MVILLAVIYLQMQSHKKNIERKYKFKLLINPKIENQHHSFINRIDLQWLYKKFIEAKTSQLFLYTTHKMDTIFYPNINLEIQAS